MTVAQMATLMEVENPPEDKAAGLSDGMELVGLAAMKAK